MFCSTVTGVARGLEDTETCNEVICSTVTGVVKGLETTETGVEGSQDHTCTEGEGPEGY